MDKNIKYYINSLRIQDTNKLKYLYKKIKNKHYIIYIKILNLLDKINIE